MERTSEREKVLDEVRHIPDAKLGDLLKILRDFRRNTMHEEDSASVMHFAGCWSDLPAEVFDTLQTETAERRKRAFSRRRAIETGAD